jgi:beta-lactamase regulating signal transducer with metallopeptidase domain
MMNFAQLAVERVLNSLPEGLLIAFSAWLLLRIMGRQNSGTRFAVWLVALAGVVALPVLGGLGFGRQALSAAIAHARPEIAVSARWAVAFFVFWIAIAAVALARVIAGVWQVREIRRSCAGVSVSDLDPSLQDLLAATPRPVRLLVSDKACVPAALGFRNPAVVLPSWMLHDLTAAELRPILIHELAHLRRHDDWTNLLQKTIRAVLFFHPAVWWIDARLSLEREMACDDAVVAATGNARAYAGCLIDLLEKAGARRSWAMAQAAVARARDASVRIARILRVGPAATTRV